MSSTNKLANIQNNKMNVVILFLAVTSICADLIGYNRMGNNVNGHYKAKIQDHKRSQSNYLKQLQQFMDSQNSEDSQAESVKHFIKANYKKVKFPFL